MAEFALKPLKIPVVVHRFMEKKKKKTLHPVYGSMASNHIRDLIKEKKSLQLLGANGYISLDVRNGKTPVDTGLIVLSSYLRF